MSQASHNRKVRMELLQARAAIERQSVVHGVQDLGASLTPRGLLESVMPKGRGGSSPDLMTRALSLYRRYPVMLSLGSAMFSRRGRQRMRWVKLAAAAFVAWRAAKSLRN